MTAVNWDAVSATISGERVLMILPSIADDGPENLQGIARRRIITMTGVCPCGAQLRYPNREERRGAKNRKRALHISVEHEEGCPTVDSTLIPLVREANR